MSAKDIKNLSVWELLKIDKLEEACTEADREFLATGDVFPLRNKIFALLRLRKLDEAVELSNQIIAMTKGETDSDFIFWGVSYWLKSDVNSALESWRAGVTVKYTDAAGGVEIPMLLLFAAIKLRDQALKKYAHDLLSDSAGKRMGNWPAPVARYLLGEITEKRMLALVDDQPILRDKQMCQAEFYIGLMQFSAGDERAFESNLRACLSHGPVCFTKAEPYLALYELERLAEN